MEEIKEHFSYDHETGFVWRIKESHLANKRLLPRRAEINTNNGYFAIKFNSKRYFAHRIAYAIFYNKDIFDFGILDHKNGNKKDNRIENLREVTRRENGQNLKRHRSGKLVGSYMHTQAKKWVARFKINKKTFHLGIYKTEQEAHEMHLLALKNLDKFNGNAKYFRELLKKH